MVAAGPIFNFILAFFLALFIVGSIGYDAPVVTDVMEGYAAAEAGMQPGTGSSASITRISTFTGR